LGLKLLGNWWLLLDQIQLLGRIFKKLQMEKARWGRASWTAT
jgi:hypothetical protein